LFNRFKEKLSGFKEALSTKIQEKVGKAEGLTEPEEVEKSGERALHAAPAATKASAVSGADQIADRMNDAGDSVTEVSGSATAQPVKPKNRFSFMEKAKSLVFEQEVILEEKDLEEPMWALEMALLESDVALPVAEEIVRAVKADLVGAKKKIGADTGRLAEDSLRGALINILSRNYLDFDEFVRKAEKPVRIARAASSLIGSPSSKNPQSRYCSSRW
jgi:fused signal recognition particle receptor